MDARAAIHTFHCIHYSGYSWLGQRLYLALESSRV